MTTQAYENARRAKEVNMAGAILLEFPAFDAHPAKTLRLGTTDFELGATEFFESRLEDMPSVKMSRDLTKDTIGFTVNDARSEFYASIKAYEDVLEDTQVTYRECLQTADGVYDPETVLVGFLDSMSYSESDQTVKFTGISDMSRVGQLMGGRILTQRYCSAIFPVGGLLPPEFPNLCGWQLTQGGNPLLCTHKRKGTDGCEDHNNAHRIVAVEALATANVTYTLGGGLGGGGWDYGGGPCFLPETRVWMASGEARPIHLVQMGELVWAFNGRGELAKRKVLQLHKHLVNFVLPMDFGRGRELTPTPNHLMATAFDTFRLAEGFDPGDTMKAQHAGAWKNLPLMATPRGLVEGRVRVHNLSIDVDRTYFVGAGDAWVAVNNVKPVGNGYPTDWYPNGF